MSAVCLYFQVHQPFRLREYDFSMIGREPHYEYEAQNRTLLNRIADRCYLPTNKILLNLIKQWKGKFKLSFSLSGCAIEQFEQYRPDVLVSFQNLAKTGCVEFLGETYYHSLSSMFSPTEFIRQVELHKKKIKSLFGVSPKVFRNTELIYDNTVAQHLKKLDFQGVVCESVEEILGNRDSGCLYKAKGADSVKCLLKNYELSEDIAYRFADSSWEYYPLSPSKYLQKLQVYDQADTAINLFMEYETFGEHQKQDTGILIFLDELPEYVIEMGEMNFATPTELLKSMKAHETYDVRQPISWEEQDRNVEAWVGNTMQQEALQRLYNLENKVLKTKNEKLIQTWGRLQTSDHFYYMTTKTVLGGRFNAHYSPYNSSYDAYINYMNILSDFESRLG